MPKQDVRGKAIMKKRELKNSFEGVKVTSASQMASTEKQAIEEGDATGAEYMDKAASGIYSVASQFILEHLLEEKLILLCGKGNNAGDAYSVGKMYQSKRGPVIAFQFFPLADCSDLCQKRAHAFIKSGGKIVFIKAIEDLEFIDNTLIIDGLFGTGFKGAVQGVMKDAIEKTNCSENLVLSIDIASGISGNTGTAEGVAIKADMTVSLGLLKVGNIYNGGIEHLGEIERVNFGMSAKYIDSIDPYGYLVNIESLKYNLPQHKRTANKYSVGKVAIVGGSPLMPGAPILAAKGALRSGAGIVQLFHPPNMVGELSSLPTEVLRGEVALDQMERFFSEVERIKGLLVGPGLGREEHIPKLLEEVYKRAKCPLVIDADALYFFKNLPPVPSILTPHRGELLHLLQANKDILETDLIDLAEEFAKQNNLVIVCKGAPTTIVFPNRKKIIVMQGNRGMASGGMGDVLAGIITSFVAQGKDIEEAAILGVTVHAMAGDKAKKKKSTYSLIASDLISELPSVFLDFGLI